MNMNIERLEEIASTLQGYRIQVGFEALVALETEFGLFFDEQKSEPLALEALPDYVKDCAPVGGVVEAEHLPKYAQACIQALTLPCQIASIVTVLELREFFESSYYETFRAMIMGFSEDFPTETNY